jgi:hypothetical protein
MGRPTPRLFFGSDNSLTFPLSRALVDPTIASADNTAVHRVEQRKMVASPFHEFLVFHERTRRRARAIVLAHRFTDPQSDRSDGRLENFPSNTTTTTSWSLSRIRPLFKLGNRTSTSTAKVNRDVKRGIQHASPILSYPPRWS